MNRLHFDVTCNRCGGSLAWVNGAHSSSLSSVAVMACVDCRIEYSVSVVMVDLAAERISLARERERNFRTLQAVG